MAHSCLSTNSPSLSTLNTRFSSIDSVPISISSRCWRVKCGGGRSGKRRWVAVRAEGGGAVKEEAEKEGGARRCVWSIRDDLPVPSSSYLPAYAEATGPTPLAYARFQSTISELFQYRIIRCGGPVDDGMANIIVAQLLYLDAIDPTKDIVMYINSPGGSVTAGMAIYDTMRHIRPDVSTVCIGLAASMAAFLLGAGTKGKRYSLPNSRIMIHQPMGDVQGTLMEQEVQRHEILHHRANLCGYLAYFTGQSIRKIDFDTELDFFMSSTEAKDYGLIDDVLVNPKQALSPLATAISDSPS
ncbi:ATP-dependent Clp protease proteolytic subunit 5, chloroplastic-like protein [Drosera capensis]